VVPQARSEKKKPPSPPVLFTKLTSRHGPLDWNTRPDDLGSLLKAMTAMMDVHFGMEVKGLAEVNADPERNPILYRSGHFHFAFTPRERRRLREYLLNGGTIVFNTGLGSSPFYDSARAELAEILPETPVRRLGADHPVFHAYYDLDRVRCQGAVTQAGGDVAEPWFDGVTVNCRTVAFVSRWDMAVGWEDVAGASILAYEPESAKQLGVNLMAYATAQRAWVRQAVRAMEFVDEDPAPPGAIQIAQIVYDGEWKTRHAGLSLLLQQFNQRTKIPVRFARQEMRLSDARLFDAPLVYLTGHEAFRFSPDEEAGLRRYLRNGGLLLAEACCGRRAFDAAFRREMARLLPGSAWVRVPGNHLLYELPCRLDTVAVTPALAAASGHRARIPPHILGLKVDARYAVLYSPYGLAGGWEMSPCPYALGYAERDALRLGQNLLLYALTQ
jgi:hypothetical protein